MDIYLSTSELAQFMGVSKSTIYRYLKKGLLKEPTRTFGGHRRFKKSDFIREKHKKRKDILYSRVSSHGQKDDLIRQKLALSQYYSKNNQNYTNNLIEISDIGSGLNFKKKGFKKMMKLIMNNEINTIYVQEKDRLSRFGFNLLQEIASEYKTKIIITNKNKNQTFEQELVQDIMSILTSFFGKIHGKRSNKNKLIYK